MNTLFTTILRSKQRFRSVITMLLLALVAVGTGCQPGGAAAQQSPHVSSRHPTPIVHPVISPPLEGSPVSLDVPTALDRTWQGYKQDFIQSDGRVIDHGRHGVTTSEGQSYALLRAVWSNDQPEFDTVWRWTHANLQVRHDHLFGYLWGKRKDGSWTILSRNSATDADEDIALALIFAARQWHASSYLTQARAIVRDIWLHEVVIVRGAPYVVAGNWAPQVINPGPAIDPSYLAPYSYRLFAGVDHSHPWRRAVGSSYRVLWACSHSKLGKSRSVGLPPNWCAIRRDTGALVASPSLPKADIYGYDAFRVMWRIALDWIWNREPRARMYLQQSAFLRHTWAQTHTLLAEYHHTGTPVDRLQDPTLYGGDIGNFVVTDPSAAQAIAQTKLLPTLRQENGTVFWGQRYSYYEQNWVWFGVALQSGRLPNLAAG